MEEKMSKLAHSNDDTMEQIEINALFSLESHIPENEAYEILFNAEVPSEKLPAAYQNTYMLWQYYNIK